MNIENISLEEFKDYKAWTGRPVALEVTEFLKILDSMEVGQAIKLKKSEWSMRTPPMKHVGNQSKNSGFKFSSKTVPDGWLILRKS